MTFQIWCPPGRVAFRFDTGQVTAAEDLTRRRVAARRAGQEVRSVRSGGPVGADRDSDSRLARDTDRDLQPVLVSCT